MHLSFGNLPSNMHYLIFLKHQIQINEVYKTFMIQVNNVATLCRAQ